MILAPAEDIKDSNEASKYHMPNLEPALQLLELLTKHFVGSGITEISNISLDVMRNLRDSPKETVLMGVMLNQEGIVLEQVSGLYSFKFRVDIGTWFPNAYGRSINIHDNGGEKGPYKVRDANPAYLPSKFVLVNLAAPLNRNFMA